jgi:hypothetical protein
MSDQPPSDTENAGQTGGITGGWSTPQTPGTWRTPEKPKEPEGWRVPVLPKDVASEPESAGEWHLPAPDDTIYTPDDEIEITQEFRPEDIVMEVAEIVSGSSAGEIVPVKEPEAPVAPEDLMFMIEHIDEQEDDGDSLQMSELVALASLVDDEPRAGVLEGEGGPIQQVTVQEEDEEALRDDRLSPSERLILGTSPAAAEDDPSAYARRQLAQLAGGVSGDTDQLTSTQPTQAESDAAAYARKQLESLGMGAGTTPDLAPAVPPPPEPIDPRQVELGRKFKETEDRVRSLRQMVYSGQMSQQDFIEQLRDAMVLDDEGVWWMLGVETDQWYRAENNTWVEAVPQPLLAFQQAQQLQPGMGLPRPGTGYGMAVDDSLPYLDQAPTIQTGRTEERSAGGYPPG